MNWKPGPARTRDGREARIYALDGGTNRNIIHGAIFSKGAWISQTWDSAGRMVKSHLCPEDLLPPKLSRDEVAMVCLNKYGQTNGTVTAMRAALDHYDQLRREGLCDE